MEWGGEAPSQAKATGTDQTLIVIGKERSEREGDVQSGCAVSEDPAASPRSTGKPSHLIIMMMTVTTIHTTTYCVSGTVLSISHLTLTATP